MKHAANAGFLKKVLTLRITQAIIFRTTPKSYIEIKMCIYK